MTSASDLTAVLERLRSAVPEAVLPPDPGGLGELLRLVPGLPSDVRQAYAVTGGMRATERLPLYLMPPRDVAATIEEVRRPDGSALAWVGRTEFGDGKTGLLLFTDDKRHIGLHLREPGCRAACLNHDEPSSEPRFKSLASILNALLGWLDHDDIDFDDIATDYPIREARAVAPDDRALSLQLLARYLGDENKCAAIAAAAIQLSHPHDMPQFLQLIDDEHTGVGEKVCRIVGLRRFEPAINRMKTGSRVATIALIGAIVALRDWPGELAADALKSLRRRLGDDYGGYFPKHLR